MSLPIKVSDELVSLTPHPIPDLRTARVLALDLGRRTGVCVGKDGAVVDSAVHELYSEREKEFTDAERLAAFFALLNMALDCEVIVFEQVAGGTKGRQTVLYNSYRATLLLWAHFQCKPVVGFSVGAVKKAMTGKGTATKDEMVSAVKEHYGIACFDDNEADAISVYKCAIDNADRLLHSSEDGISGEKYDPAKAPAKRPRSKRATSGNNRSGRPSGSGKKLRSKDAAGSGVRKSSTSRATKGDASSGAKPDRRRTKRKPKGSANKSSNGKDAT